MQMQNLLKVSNKVKKSHVLLVGSFLIFMGILSLLWNYFLRMRDEVYSDMKIAMMDEVPISTTVSVDSNSISDVIEDVPIVQNVASTDSMNHYVVDYSKYLGVLEIPKIGLKRGFYNIDSKYNNIQYNVTLLEGSSMPDVDGGNLVLVAHSGDAYISYFSNLYRLNVGDIVFVTYGGIKYAYHVVNIYEVEKNGLLSIQRNCDKTTLTMITCTKDNDFTQTVYISELVG